MVATFVVEDGTGLSTANSYISVADADTYFDNYATATTWSNQTTTQKQLVLRIGTQYLDQNYSRRWLGRKGSLEQRLDWPRSSAEDRDDYLRPSNTLPPELVDATCEAALKQITLVAAGESLLPDVAAPTATSKELIKAGSVTIEDQFYEGRGGLVKYTTIEYLLRPILRSGWVAARA